MVRNRSLRSLYHLETIWGSDEFFVLVTLILGCWRGDELVQHVRHHTHFSNWMKLYSIWQPGGCQIEISEINRTTIVESGAGAFIRNARFDVNGSNRVNSLLYYWNQFVSHASRGCLTTNFVTLSRVTEALDEYTFCHGRFRILVQVGISLSCGHFSIYCPFEMFFGFKYRDSEQV
jgi:hypothetical protein